MIRSYYRYTAYLTLMSLANQQLAYHQNCPLLRQVYTTQGFKRPIRSKINTPLILIAINADIEHTNLYACRLCVRNIYKYFVYLIAIHDEINIL